VKFGHLLSVVVAAIFIPFGAWALLDPVAVAGLTQVQLPTPAALADGRAVYGGLTLGLGAFFALCAVRQELVRPGLWAVLLTVAGPFLGRLAGVVGDGAGRAETYRTLTSEFAIAALAAVSLARGVSKRTSRATSSAAH
jgi:hypothetical protein